MILLDPRLTIGPKWRLEKDAIAQMLGYDALLSTDDFSQSLSAGKDNREEIESQWKVVRNGAIREVCTAHPEVERFLTKTLHQTEIDRIRDGLNSAEESARNGRYDQAAAWAGVSLELMLQVEFGDLWPVKRLERHPELGRVPEGVSKLMYEQRKRIAERWGSPSGPLVKRRSRTISIYDMMSEVFNFRNNAVHPETRDKVTKQDARFAVNAVRFLLAQYVD